MENKEPFYYNIKFWCVMLVVVIVVIAVLFNSEDISSNKSTVSSSNTEITPSSATPTQENQNNSKSNEQKQVHVGEEISTSNTKITFVSVNDFTQYKSYSQPKSGNKVIRAEFSFENISNSDVSLNNIECYADGEKCENYYSADDYKSTALESLSSGKKLKAVVYYEVPTDAQSVILEYETNMWTSDKIEFIVK